MSLIGPKRKCRTIKRMSDIGVKQTSEIRAVTSPFGPFETLSDFGYFVATRG
jgi:hypothetical protein